MPKGSDMTSKFFPLVPREQQDDEPEEILDDIIAYADECYSPTSKKEPSLLTPPHKKKNKKIGVFLTQEEITAILEEAWRWDDDSYDVDFLCSAMAVSPEEPDDCRRVLSFCSSDDESC
jgi:hypothetical protein